MNRANYIVDDTRVLFVFLDFGGNGVPKGDDGEKIFNVKHTERMRSHGANAEERMRSHGGMIYRFICVYISLITYHKQLLHGVYAK